MGGGYGSEGWGAGGWGAGDLDPGFSNLSFEISDGARGAASWTHTSEATGEDWATYGAGFGLLGVETFEGGWLSNESYVFEYQPPELAIALYSALFFATPLTVEGFEAGWHDNQHRLTTTADFGAAVFGPHTVENFETGWGNTTYETAFAGGDLAAASYAPTPNAFENFEAGWKSNQNYATDWGTLSIASPTYSGARAIVGLEDFEHVKADASFQALATDGTITQIGHGLGVAYRVQLTESATGTLPLGFSPGLTYYVKTVLTADTFLISTTLGGTTVANSDAGIGVNFVHAPFEYWTTLLGI